jgi:glycosyltransferase involved in cell wall biosynthesis
VKPLRIVLMMIEAPLPFGHAAARWSYVLLKGLVERGHDVTAFAACSTPMEIDRVKELFPSGQYDLRCYAFPRRSGFRAKVETLRQPYSYPFSPELRRDLDAELSRSFDILHLEQVWSGWLGLQHARKTLLHILSLYNIDLAEVPNESFVNRMRRSAMLRTEIKLLRHYPTISTLSKRLYQRIQVISPVSQAFIIPLALDLSLYPFNASNIPEPEPVVSLIGSFSWYPTLSAGVRLLTRLWPEIRQHVPNARLQIVGREARSALRDYLGQPGVTIHENVPDILPYFLNSSVLLYAPHKGSGMKIKVMEALALGVPVVTNTEGAEGLPLKDGVHGGVCDDDSGLIGRTVALLTDHERGLRQRLAARDLLETQCHACLSLDKVEQAYEAIVRRDQQTGNLCSINCGPSWLESMQADKRCPKMFAEQNP